MRAIAPTTRTRTRRRATEVLAGLITAALVGTGIAMPVAASATTDVKLETTPTACVANPMGAATPIGSESGYTIYTTGDAILANGELEGTLAVGGTATFGDSRGQGGGQYPIFHGGVGGNVNYTPPTIDGSPNRVLIQRLGVSESAPKVTQVKRLPADSPLAQAKIVDQTVPAGYTFGQGFGSDGTTFFPQGGTNQSAQLESFVQPWDGGTGAASFVTDEPAFTDYFPADSGSQLLAQTGIWKTPTITPGGETGIALDPTGPNRVTLDEIDDAPKFRLTGYSATSPLIVTVTAEDLVGGVLTLPSELNAGKESGGEALSYVLWDLSSISGPVTIVAFSEPVRGAIYAPNADVTFPTEAQGGKEFEGQLIARTLTALQGGKEMHTNLFKGVLECADQPRERVGGFSLEKVVAGSGADLVPDTTTFTVHYFVDGATEPAGSLTIGADGAAVAGPQNLPTGTVVTFTEVEPAAIEGGSWTGIPAISPAQLTIGDGTNPTVTVTNTFDRAKVGGFSLKKALAGDGVGLVDAAATFTVDYFVDGAIEPAGSLTIGADGAVVAGPQDLPAGSVVTFAERVPAAIDGAGWAGASVSPASITIGDGTNPTVTVTNTFSQKVGGFSLKKALAGDGAGLVDAAATFTVDYFVGGATEPAGSLTIGADGAVVAGPQDLPKGSVVTFAEREPAGVEGASWGGASVSPASITIGDGTNPTVTVTNTFSQKVGGFSLKKALAGDGAGLVDAAATFTVDYFVDGAEQPAGQLVIGADGAVVTGPQNLPQGAVVTFQEREPAEVEGASWDGASVSPASITIGDGTNPTVTVTNTYAQLVGGFALKKAVTGDGADLVADAATFTIRYFLNGDTVAAGEIDVTASGAVVDGPQTLPYGTVVQFAEAAPAAVPGATWTTVDFSVPSIVIGDGTNPTVSVVNTIERTLGGFALHKVIDGSGAALVPTDASFEVDYFIDGASEPAGTVTLSADGSTVVGADDLPHGAVITFAERTPAAVDGGAWRSVSFSQDEVVVSGGEIIEITVTNTITRGGALAVTGGVLPIGLTVAALVLAALGVGLFVAARRRAA